jgi:hypothetical protein
MSIPSQAALLEVALQYLETDLLPTLEGEHRFKTRLAINALRIVQREGASIDQRKVQPEDTSPKDGSQAAKLPINEEALAQQIRSGEVSIKDPGLLAQLKQSLEQALAINNPKWLKRK